MVRTIIVGLVVLVVLFLGAWTVPAFGGDAIGEGIKDQMRGLMQDFQGLEFSLSKKPPDYDAIIKTLDEMEARTKAVQSLKASGHPGKTLKILVSDIEDFKKSARAKNHAHVEDSMNRLAENCFRCHLSHGEPAKGKASGNAL